MKIPHKLFWKILGLSVLLLSVVIKPLEHLLLVFLIPLLVGLLYFLLHIIQSIPKHLRELLAHLIDAASQLLDLLFLLRMNLTDLSLNVAFGCCEPRNLLFIVLLATLQLVYLIHEVLFHGLVLASHVRYDEHHGLPLLGHLVFQHHFSHSLLFSAALH